MSAVAFDTLKFAQNLRDKANFSPAQAEGVSQAFSEAITDQLATWGTSPIWRRRTTSPTSEGNGRLQASGKGDFARLEVKIELTRSEILRCMFGQTLLILGAVLAIGRFWH